MESAKHRIETNVPIAFKDIHWNKTQTPNVSIKAELASLHGGLSPQRTAVVRDDDIESLASSQPAYQREAPVKLHRPEKQPFDELQYLPPKNLNQLWKVNVACNALDIIALTTLGVTSFSRSAPFATNLVAAFLLFQCFIWASTELDIIPEYILLMQRYCTFLFTKLGRTLWIVAAALSAFAIASTWALILGGVTLGFAAKNLAVFYFAKVQDLQEEMVSRSRDYARFQGIRDVLLYSTEANSDCTSHESARSTTVSISG
eukprot:GILJ01005477.1.p1 GENE.GILJ01005477.1~~GILJ01005477.1.p1  ORF type:complete len:260 (+),score=26.73 GILJ01005477.1:139-918(+)